MDPMTLFGLGMGGSALGSILGGLGASSSASSANKAAADARNFAQTQYTQAQLLPALMAMGGGAPNFLRMILPADQANQLLGPGTADQESIRKQIADLDAQIAGWKDTSSTRNALAGLRGNGDYSRVATPQASKADLQAKRAALAAQLTQSSDTTKAMSEWGSSQDNPINALQSLAQSSDERGRGLLGSFDAGTSRLMQLIKGFGDQERKDIATQSARDLQGLNRQTGSELAARGMALSSMAPQLAAMNTRMMGERRDTAMGNLNDRISAMNVNTLGGRLNSRAGLQGALDDRSLQSQGNVANTRLQLLTGQTWNPWAGQNTTQYYPGLSSLGAFSSTIGNSMAGMGGTMGMLGALRSLTGRGTQA